MMKNQPEESEANKFTHWPIFSNGILPGPSGSVAKHFQTTYRIPTRCQQATDFNGFLRKDALQPMELNVNTIPRLSLVGIPISSKVRLVFGVCFGSQIIGTITLSITNQNVVLSGEGETDLGCPNMLTLSVSIHQFFFDTTDLEIHRHGCTQAQ